jgi:hypothetical protein
LLSKTRFGNEAGFLLFAAGAIDLKSPALLNCFDKTQPI